MNGFPTFFVYKTENKIPSLFSYHFSSHAQFKELSITIHSDSIHDNVKILIQNHTVFDDVEDICIRHNSNSSTYSANNTFMWQV